MLVKTDVIFSSKKQDWATPQYFFDELDAEFDFTLDVCADDRNHKCDRYFTEEQNGLVQDWSSERVFCNPPYNQVGAWAAKCRYETKIRNCDLAVMLVPARTDTRWFHQHIYHDADEIRFVKGRLKFGGHTVNAPFPSMVVVYWGSRMKY